MAEFMDEEVFCETEVIEFFSRFPHIHAKIIEHWGSKKGRDYIYELMINNRNVLRKGFSTQDSMTIFRLQSAHDRAFPAFILQTDNFFSGKKN